MPSCCPFPSIAGIPCVVTFHHRRDRTTGPCFPLTVLYCKTHGRAFTLYPPGFAPHARQPVIQLGPDGTSILGEKACEGTPSCAAAARTESPEAKIPTELQKDFEKTLFHAALDASVGRPWARDSLSEIPDKWWPTQGRHLNLAAQLFGFAANTGERVRETIAQVLSVDHLFLKDQAREVRDHPGYRGLGGAICRVLSRLKGGANRARDLLFCGWLVGRWGKPLHWDPERKLLEQLPFPHPGGVA